MRAAAGDTAMTDERGITERAEWVKALELQTDQTGRRRSAERATRPRPVTSSGQFNGPGRVVLTTLSSELSELLGAAPVALKASAAVIAMSHEHCDSEAPIPDPACLILTFPSATLPSVTFPSSTLRSTPGHTSLLSEPYRLCAR